MKKWYGRRVLSEEDTYIWYNQIFFFENQEKLQKILVFRVFIALAYLFFQGVIFPYLQIKWTHLNLQLHGCTFF